MWLFYYADCVYNERLDYILHWWFGHDKYIRLGWDFLLFYYNVDELSLADELSLSDLTKNYQVKL